MSALRQTNTVWLVVQKHRRGSSWGGPIIRSMHREKPALAGDQVAVKVRLAIDPAVFDAPLLDVELVVNPEQIARPELIQEADS